LTRIEEQYKTSSNLSIRQISLKSRLCISVCGIWTQEEVPEVFKPEKIVVLNIENITVHPNFVHGKV
jgi:hypothetical protein